MKTTHAITLAALLATGTITTAHAADYAAGLSLGSTGLQAEFSLRNDFQLRESDQIQTRFALGGASDDNNDDLEINDTDYKGDFDLTTAKATMDWFPFAGKARKVFFSAGLLYVDGSVDANADLTKTFDVGGTSVKPGDIQELRAKIEQDAVSPYLGVGWGNRIGNDNGFSFVAELGIAIPTGKADVTLTAKDSNNHLSAAALRKEERSIRDESDDISALASVGVTYHF